MPDTNLELWPLQTLAEIELRLPLETRQATRWEVRPLPDAPTIKLAEIFGVMAVAGAMGKFHGKDDGFTPAGEAPTIQWPNYLSGPHRFLVRADGRLQVLLADKAFCHEVSRSAYRWAHNRLDAGYLAEHIYAYREPGGPGPLWPLPNVEVVHA